MLHELFELLNQRWTVFCIFFIARCEQGYSLFPFIDPSPHLFFKPVSILKVFVFGLELLTTTEWIMQSGWSYHEVNHWFVDHIKTIICIIHVILYWKQIERSSRAHTFVGQLRKKSEQKGRFSHDCLHFLEHLFETPVYMKKVADSSPI